ncbi:MAG: TlpA disulfide reductase family protein [Gammaproteobacteria bacterium]|nr:TlpA disulfide reductase family protein [Gammaproteobacteria bacterium]
MRRTLTLFIALSGLLGGGLVFAEEMLVSAGPAEFRAALDARRDRVVLVNFWATWCRPCLKELPDLLKLEDKYAAQGFELLAVSLDEPVDRETVVRPFLAKWFPGLRSLIRLSPDMDSMVSVVDPAWNEVLPTSYVLDGTGQVRAKLQGGKSAAEFEAAILPLLVKP